MQMEQTYTLPSAHQLASRMPAANVSSNERLFTVLAGAALLGYAWKNGSRSLGLMSAGLLARGATDTRRALTGGRGIHIRESVTINAPADRIYRFWRQLDRLPEVMPHLAKV